MLPRSTTSEERRRFQVKHCLGRGGFGEVYLATLNNPGGVRSQVAIKVLYADLDPRSQSVQRLRDEGRLLGILNHPSILGVHDLVVLEDRVTLVMDYVDGADLDRCMERGMAIGPLLEAIARVADALDAAWTTPGEWGKPLQLVHRDVKPNNIRVGKHGDVKLLDFGIARARGEREAMTRKNTLMGSFLYMAPERFFPDNDASAPCDVYGLGCTLFEGLAGEALFGSIEVRAQAVIATNEEMHDEFVGKKIDALVDIPDPVVDLLREMLAHDPNRRPQAGPLAARLEDLLPIGSSLRRWCRNFDWPPPAPVSGDLEGRHLVETTLTRTSETQDEFATVLMGQPGRPSPLPRVRPTTSMTEVAPAAIAGVGIATVLAAVVMLLAVGLWALSQQKEGASTDDETLVANLPTENRYDAIVVEPASQAANAEADDEDDSVALPRARRVRVRRTASARVDPALADAARVEAAPMAAEPEPEPEPEVDDDAVATVEDVPEASEPVLDGVLETLDFDATRGRVTVRGRLDSSRVRPFGYPLDGADPRYPHQYVVQLPRTRNGVGLSKIPVASPLVDSVAIRQGGDKLLVVVNSKSTEPLDIQWSQDGNAFAVVVTPR